MTGIMMVLILMAILSVVIPAIMIFLAIGLVCFIIYFIAWNIRYSQIKYVKVSNVEMEYKKKSVETGHSTGYTSSGHFVYSTHYEDMYLPNGEKVEFRATMKNGDIKYFSCKRGDWRYEKYLRKLNRDDLSSYYNIYNK